MKPFIDIVLENCEYDQGNLDRVVLKAVNADFTTRGGFRWAFPGYWTRDPEATGDYTNDVCPRVAGDGLSVALTVYGMAQGGYSPHTILVVGFNNKDVIAEDGHKLKVVRAKTLALVDGWKLIRQKCTGADLGGAYLEGAYLEGADLGGADLGGAYLGQAHLGGANLGGAYLGGAYLGGADLGGANLEGADLGGATGRDDWDDLVKRGAIR